MSYSWFLFKSVLPAVFLFYDFSLFFFLCSLCLLGSGVAAAFLVVYVLSAARGHSIGVRKHSITGNRFGKPSYRSLEQFLGLNPFWRIVWPFHPIYKPESTFVQMSWLAAIFNISSQLCHQNLCQHSIKNSTAFTISSLFDFIKKSNY